MSSLSIDQKNAVLTSISIWAPRVIDKFLDIKRDDKSGVIITKKTDELKNKAGKLANILHQVGVNQSTAAATTFIDTLDNDEELHCILGLMDNPRNVRATDLSLIGHETEIRKLIAQQLIAFAKTIRQEYEITPPQPDEKQHPQASAPLLSDLNLSAEQMTYVVNFQTSLDESKTLYEKRLKTIDIIKDSSNLASFGLFYVVILIGQGLSNGGGEGGCAAVAVMGVLCLFAALIAAVTYSVIGCLLALVYGVTKFADSLAKVATVFSSPINALRGLVRAAMIGIGTLGAVKGGMLIGALIGTLVLPGFGTAIGVAAGAILGACVGGCLGIGIAAYLSKHLLRKVSSVISSDSINPSNPYRYTLTTIQKTRLEAMGVKMDGLKSVLKELRSMKRDIPFLACVKSADKGRKFKQKANNLIEDLKNGLVTEKEIAVNGKTFTLFNNNNITRTTYARNLAYHLTPIEPSAPPESDAQQYMSL